MRRDGFYIIRCPKCGRYTYAPVRQKTRLCVYCQRIFKINPLSAVYVEDAKTARTRVKLYQTGKRHQEFIDAIEKSRKKIESLVPKEKVELTQLQDSRREYQPASVRRRELEQILYQNALTTPIDLQDLEQACQEAGIPWNWATKQIEALIRSGYLIAPKPWQIRLIGKEEPRPTNVQTSLSPTKLAREIGKILRESQKPMSQTTLLEQLDLRSISNVAIEEALDLLRRQGYILKTATGVYKWIAE